MPRGGAREGAGRKSRPAPKSKGVWLGQITDEQRDFIIQWLSPDERFSALWAAANKACSNPLGGLPEGVFMCECSTGGKCSWVEEREDMARSTYFYNRSVRLQNEIDEHVKSAQHSVQADVANASAQDEPEPGYLESLVQHVGERPFRR